MRGLIQLTRPLNLLIVVITMAAMRYGVIGAFLDLNTLNLHQVSPNGEQVFAHIPDNEFRHAFGEALFWLLVASTVLIAAGGNMINDYFDTRIDRLNKPDSVIVGRSVKRRVAMAGHLILSGAGLLIGVFVAWRTGQWKLMIVPAFAVGTLWFYSTNLKRSFLIGNGAVALLSGLVPLLVGLYEIPALFSAYPTSVVADADGQQWEATFDFLQPWRCILVYAAFAFITTLVRELQKDMADVKGDQADGCRTVPIVLGMGWAKAITLFYTGVTCAAVLIMLMAFLPGRLPFWYLTFGVLGPLLLSAGFTFNARTRREHLTAANLMKLAMFMAVMFAFLLNHTLWSPDRLLPPGN